MSLRIIKAGLLDTIQDAGRYGYQHLGINVGGTMDRFSAQLANALLGKDLAAPVIEMHFPAAVLQFEQAAVICLTGADFSPTINDEPVPMHQPLVVNKGVTLKFKEWKMGARCYLACLPNLQLKNWLGSFSTATGVNANGYEGRPLAKEDCIAFKDSLPLEQPLQEKKWMRLPWKVEPLLFTRAHIHFITGNEWNTLSIATQTAFLNNNFTITAASNRMGYRLYGEPLQIEVPIQLISSAVSFGTIQLLPNGQLIILMADHQTTGGYPKIGHVISAHLPYLAQAKPNDTIRFNMVTQKLAEESWLQQQQYLHNIQNTATLKMNTVLYALH